jgi:hypothetical protein
MLTNTQKIQAAMFLSAFIGFFIVLILSGVPPQKCRQKSLDFSFAIKSEAKNNINKAHTVEGIDSKNNYKKISLYDIQGLYDSIKKSDWIIKEKGDTLYRLYSKQGDIYYESIFAPYCYRYYPCLYKKATPKARKTYDSLEALVKAKNL